MSCPLTARCYPTSWKGAVSVPAPHRAGHGAGGALGMPFSSCSPWSCAVPLLEQTCWDDGRHRCHVSMLEERCHSPMDEGKRHQGPERSSLSPWGTACSVETQPFNQEPLPSRTVHQAALWKDFLGFYSAMRHWMTLLHQWLGTGKTPGIKCT